MNHSTSSRSRSRLRARWHEAFWLLKLLRARPAEAWEAEEKAQLRAALAALDHAWASFEERFFYELAHIEREAMAMAARGAHLVQAMRSAAVEAWASIAATGAEPSSDPRVQHCCRQLVDYIARLNLSVNPSCAGRSFGIEVLSASRDVIEYREAQGALPVGAVDPAYALAACAAESFSGLCDYLSQGMSNLDLSLSDNPELVGLLAAWESSWMLAETYVVDMNCRHAIGALMGYILKARTVSPELAATLGGRDPELFLVLPRIVWLGFLDEPIALEPLLGLLLLVLSTLLVALLLVVNWRTSAEAPPQGRWL